jgi:hypothetical protein
VILPWWSLAPLRGGSGVELCLRVFVCGVVSLQLIIYQCFFPAFNFIKRLFLSALAGAPTCIEVEIASTSNVEV